MTVRLCIKITSPRARGEVGLRNNPVGGVAAIGEPSWIAPSPQPSPASGEREPNGAACMPAAYPEEAKNFRLLGHDPSAAWGGGSLVQVHKGHAYVGGVGGSSYNGPEGFTVHDVRDPT